MSKLLITGATGNLGTAFIDELIGKKGVKNISALVRDLSKAGKLKEKGVQLIQGDYNDYNSLVTAFTGMDKLYFISGSDVLNRAMQHENIVKAAKSAKVGHIIYTSFQRKTDDKSSPIALVASAHILAEKLIRESGLTYTIMKHALYTDFVPIFMGDQVLNSGVIFLPAGNGKTSFTLRSDMASAGVAVLTGEGHENKTYEISANKSYSFYDIAQILTELSGKQIKYAAPDVETFSKTLEQAGVPKDAIQGTASFCLAIAQGEFDFPDNTLEKLIGRKPESLKDFLKKAYKL
jgi:NAD(P)H dehydrogenase (quinone)